ncbi:putative glutathione S-transferase [Hoeflea marina]|uniref:Putative glutathione S-transferase n=1 Tax=Hoeflea marina TaxID=274592 RepID=A0A317PME2_9HYPH|nr:glutathione S-transferase C-terminal domain-containing protein [Hoeflea marina]PWW01927.1 putative glutathione S-transferase [Hoeflea marina]
MGILHEGRWNGGDDRQIGASGWEPRQEHLRGTVSAKPDGGALPAVAGRYHLIDCPGCPLSHRVTMALRMKGLEGSISTARVRPVMGPNGREFETGDHPVDPVTGFRFLYEAYIATDPTYSGRASTPVLWDRHQGRIVSNCYSDIFGMVNGEFEAFAERRVDFRPEDLRDELAAELSWLGQNFTGAVYRCGFARDQAVFDDYVERIRTAVSQLDAKLADRLYLLGDRVTEADLALLACLLRFDAIYLPLFQCTSARIADHPVICAYVDRMLALPGIAESFDINASMTHYYRSHAHINPTRIVPPQPSLGWTLPAVCNSRGATY